MTSRFGRLLEPTLRSMGRIREERIVRAVSAGQGEAQGSQ
jgi:hypothetical protein